jgi:hypothetical protein
MPDDMPAVPVERRQNLKLRAVFDEVYEHIAPFLDPAQTWGGMSLQHFAFRTIRERHPGLSPAEAHQLVVAAVRVFRARNPGQGGHLPQPEELAATLPV